jgi:hypothetical protein
LQGELNTETLLIHRLVKATALFLIDLEASPDDPITLVTIDDVAHG